MDPATVAVIGGVAGLVGGIAGVVAAVWTIIWSLTLKPRVRWSLNRFTVQSTMDPPPLPASPDGTVPAAPLIVLDPPILRFYFRNVGTAAADDAHAIISGGRWENPVEFPATGRERIDPGKEIVVEAQASPLPNVTAGRPYASGDDWVFDLKEVTVEVGWRRQTVGFARRKFDLDKLQREVPAL